MRSLLLENGEKEKEQEEEELPATQELPPLERDDDDDDDEEEEEQVEKDPDQIQVEEEEKKALAFIGRTDLLSRGKAEITFSKNRDLNILAIFNLFSQTFFLEITRYRLHIKFPTLYGTLRTVGTFQHILSYISALNVISSYLPPSFLNKELWKPSARNDASVWQYADIFHNKEQEKKVLRINLTRCQSSPITVDDSGEYEKFQTGANDRIYGALRTKFTLKNVLSKRSVVKCKLRKSPTYKNLSFFFLPPFKMAFSRRRRIFDDSLHFPATNAASRKEIQGASTTTYTVQTKRITANN